MKPYLVSASILIWSFIYLSICLFVFVVLGFKASAQEELYWLVLSTVHKLEASGRRNFIRSHSGYVCVVIFLIID